MRGAVVAIGNFDGLHRGHQALFARARARAHERNTRAGVLTFEPHPTKVLAPHLAPPLILTRGEKVAGLDAAGLDAAVLEPFNRDFASLSPRAFVTDVLSKGLGVSGVVVGSDFRFGQRGEGRVADLEAWLPELGITLDVVPPVLEEGMVCSSSRIRQFVLDGRIEAANLLLGRPYHIHGTVEAGDARGRRMGIPTANLATDRELLPRLGVYASRARLADGSLHDSVTNLGLRPTFDGEGVRIEVHLLDYTGDLYDQPIDVFLVSRLRDEQRFSDADALRAQIAQDIAQARELLGHAALPSETSPFRARDPS